jgi:uncharacterized protein
VTAHLCDINIWLALSLSGHAHHEVSRDWLETIEEPASIQFCRATQQGLLRLLTNTAVLGPYGNQPLTNKEAWAVYEAFVADDRIVLRPDEPSGVGSKWKDLAAQSTTSPKLWMDAYLAAFALAGGCRMVTTDTGFRKFPDLDLVLLG